MWTNPLDLLVQRFPGSSTLAASTILGETPSCVAVHQRVLHLLAAYPDVLPYAERLHRTVPGSDADLTLLLHLEPLLRRLDWLLEELVGHPRRARRLTRRLNAVLTTMETRPAPPALVGLRAGGRSTRRTSFTLRRR